MARVFRIFKLGKYSQGMQMFAIVMAKSLDALALLSFFLVLVIILFGALIYFCEAGLDNWSHELGGFVRPDVTGDNYELSPFNLFLRRFGGSLLRPRPLDMATCIQLVSKGK